MAIAFNIMPKWRNLAKSGHAGSVSSTRNPAQSRRRRCRKISDFDSVVNFSFVNIFQTFYWNHQRAEGGRHHITTSRQMSKWHFVEVSKVEVWYMLNSKPI